MDKPNVIWIERSQDYGLIRAIMTEPSVYPHLSDDFSPSAAAYRPIESEAFWYLLVRDGGEILGLFLLVPQNGVCWEIHTALLPTAWGERAHEAALVARDWIWKHTPCRRIVTNVPENNRLAHKFALDAGMRAYGRNPASFLKDGKLLDQICLGVSRPCEKFPTESEKEALCQAQ